jgi:rhodanese-related sulfurtransferase
MGNLQDGIEQIDVDDAAERVAAGAFLLDVREIDEWVAGHAPDATHLPMSAIADAHAGTLPRDKQIVTMCKAGARSQRVAKFLQQSGYDAVNVVGGMLSWAAAGREVTTDSGEPGTVA